MKIELNSIGYVKNDICDKKDAGWGSDVSEILINQEYENGLSGLLEFSHIIVIYYLHEARFNTLHSINIHHF